MWLDLAGQHGRTHCRDLGSGEVPLIHLHGGWGYSIYPIDRQVQVLGARLRILVPDRLGFGRSGRAQAGFPLNFHRRAAYETLAVMDALELERAMIWGHSDGAVIAAWMGIEAPERCQAIVLEALHFDRAKPRSRGFFEAMATNPDSFGERACRVLAEEHGEDYWRDLLGYEGELWLALGESEHLFPDLYDGRLAELTAPVLVLHGAEDPRTEPGELEAVAAALPRAEVCMIEGGRHCPHAESSVADVATAATEKFLIRHLAS